MTLLCCHCCGSISRIFNEWLIIYMNMACASSPSIINMINQINWNVIMSHQIILLTESILKFTLKYWTLLILNYRKANEKKARHVFLILIIASWSSLRAEESVIPDRLSICHLRVIVMTESNSYFSLSVIFYMFANLLWTELLINSWLLHAESERRVKHGPDSFKDRLHKCIHQE